MTAQVLNLTQPVSWKLADDNRAGPGRTRAFSMLAYSGKALCDVGFGPFVIDLAGLEIPSTLPIFRQHDANQYVGRADQIGVKPPGLQIAGFLFDTDAGREIALMSDSGAEWQASIGFAFDLDSCDYVSDRATEVINGQAFEGPFLAIRKAKLRESSFVPLGADSSTHAVALAAAINAHRPTVNPIKEAAMASPEKVAASVKELRAAFPNDPTFALDAAERGLSLLEAKAEYGDKLQAQLSAQAAEQTKKIADLEAKLAQAVKPNPAGALGGSAPGTAPEQSADPIHNWQVALAAECDRLTKIGWRAPASQDGLTLSAEGALRAHAMHNVSEKNPALHQAYLEAFNGEDWTRIRREQRKLRVGR